MKIGLIVAIEMDSVFAYYPQRVQLPCPPGFDLYRIEKDGCEIYVLHTGMGEIAAAAGTQYLITGCGVEMIVNFGVVGGLTEEMKRHKICVIDRVVHYRYDCTEFMDLKLGQVDGHDSVFLKPDPALAAKVRSLFPELSVSICCSGDRFVGKQEDKRRLHEEFEGDVCDMESAGIVLTCEANAVPCLLLKAVSDGLADGAKGFYEELQDAALRCLQTTDAVLRDLRV
ncbi:MAG: 5'-methylthioadenosine/S-adenosylhomocysteine nucleosidase [Clostridia bacterium]|nr:5'-methylthioadenosine/S-adenosylhomocysteine nucleosidase [Clostridia bacterium]